MLSENRIRLARAYESLQGLSCGDAFGQGFFKPEEIALSMIRQRALPVSPWRFTDDTMMALSIVSALEEHGEIHQDHLALSFSMSYDRSRGYGPAMHDLLPRLRRKAGCWREESRSLFGGEGSFGNGSAMRVAPLGAYFADDLDATCAIVGGIVFMCAGLESIPSQWLESREPVPRQSSQ